MCVKYTTMRMLKVSFIIVNSLTPSACMILNSLTKCKHDWKHDKEVLMQKDCIIIIRIKDYCIVKGHHTAEHL